jgi:hypothetical protein
MSVTGTWKLEVVVAWRVIKPTLTLSQSGLVLTGSMSLDGHTVPIKDGKINGNHVSWKVTVRNQDGTMTTLAFDGTIDGGTMAGTVDTPWGTFNFTGKKRAGIGRFFGLARSADSSRPASPM